MTKEQVIKGIETHVDNSRSCKKCPYFDERPCCLYKLMDDALALLKESEPVKHGRWIPVDSYSAFGGSEEVWRAHGIPTAYHYCSECKEQSSLDEFGYEILSKYCLNCGADLREGK